MKYFFRIIIFLLLGCNSESDTASFNRSHSLSGHPVEDISILTGEGNVNLAIADTFLVIQKSEEPFIQVYSTNSHKRLTQFGKRGKGPGELLNPRLLDQVKYDSNNGYPIFTIFDDEMQKVIEFNILDILNGEGLNTGKKVPSKSFLPFLHFYNDTLFVASPSLDKRLLINSSKTERVYIPYIPKPDFEITKERYNHIYRSAVAVNSEKELIAAAPILLGQIDFFNLHGNHISSTSFSSQSQNSSNYTGSIDAFQESTMHIEDLTVSNNLIYGLNLSTSIHNYARKEGPFNMKVQVFNWEGEALKTYSLDDRLITTIAVDSVHNRIYGFNPTTKKNRIIKYDLQASL